MPMQVGTAAIDGNKSGTPTTSQHTMSMQDGMFTRWDERLVAQMITDTTQAVAPTAVSLCLAQASHRRLCIRLAARQHGLRLWVMLQIITFDTHGVSGHANHRAVHRGLL